MIDMYSRLVKAGLRTIEKVPNRFRDAVIADLISIKLDKNGNKITISDNFHHVY